jgi:hypothetical protein
VIGAVRAGAIGYLLIPIRVLAYYSEMWKVRH